MSGIIHPEMVSGITIDLFATAVGSLWEQEVPKEETACSGSFASCLRYPGDVGCALGGGVPQRSGWT
jgi:hypothetical protein